MLSNKNANREIKKKIILFLMVIRFLHFFWAEKNNHYISIMKNFAEGRGGPTVELANHIRFDSEQL